MAELAHQDRRPGLLSEVFIKYLEQLHPSKNLKANLPDRSVGRTFVVGAIVAASSINHEKKDIALRSLCANDLGGFF